MVLQGLDGRLSLQHEGRIIVAQEAPPGPGVLRNVNGNGTSSIVSIQTPDPELWSEPSATALELLNTETDQEGDHGASIDDMDVAELQLTASPRKPTFLQKERWKVVQQAKLRGLSIRGMAKELGMHGHTVRRYIDAGSPPTRRSRATPATLPSDTFPDWLLSHSQTHRMCRPRMFYGSLVSVDRTNGCVSCEGFAFMRVVSTPRRRPQPADFADS